MRRSDTSSRRFYRLFYQWTVLTSSRSAAVSAPRAPSSFPYHTTSRLKDAEHDQGVESLAAPRITKQYDKRPTDETQHRQRHRDIPKVVRIGSRSQQYNSTRRERVALKSSDENQNDMFQGPIQSVAERPFSTLKPGDCVIRFKSDTLIKIEVALSGDVLKELQKKYGQQLENTGRGEQAIVDIQALEKKIDLSLGNTPENTLHSIVVTGTPHQVDRSLRKLLKRPNGRRTTLPEVPRSWRTTPVQSAAQRPFSSMEIGHTAFRFRSEMTLVIECAFAGPVLQRMEQHFGRNLQNEASQHAVTVEIQRVPDGSLPPVTSMLLSGPFQGVHELWNLTRHYGAHRSPAASAGEPRSILTANKPPGTPHLGQLGSHLQMSIVEKDWMRLAATGDVTSIAKTNGANIVVGEPEQRALNKHSSDSESVRSLFIIGSDAAIQATQSAILSVIGESSGAIEDQAPETLAEDLRLAMRSLTHPVVLITSTLPTTASGKLITKIEAARGVTVSSFTTVALQPRPVVSFNLKVPSRTWDVIRSTKKLGMHVLAASTEGASLASMFARPHSDPRQPFLELHNKAAVWLRADTTHPIEFSRAQTTLFRLNADLLQDKCVEVGDHMIVVAEVTGCNACNNGRDSGMTTTALTYGRQGYRNEGQELIPSEFPSFKEYRNEKADVFPSEASRDATNSTQSLNATMPAESQGTGRGKPSNGDDTVTTGSSGLAQSLEEGDHPVVRPYIFETRDRATQRSPSPGSATNRVSRQYNPLTTNREARTPHESGQRRQPSSPRTENLNAHFASDPVYSALRATRDAEQTGDDIDAHQIMSDLDEAMGLTMANEQNGEHNPQETQGQGGVMKLSTSDEENADIGHHSLWEPADVIREESARLAEKEHPNGAVSTSGPLKEQESSAELVSDMGIEGSQASLPAAEVTLDDIGNDKYDAVLWAPNDMAREDSARLAEKETRHDPADATSVSQNTTMTSEPYVAGSARAASIPQGNEINTKPDLTEPSNAATTNAWGLKSWFQRSYSTSSRSRNGSLTHKRHFQSTSMAMSRKPLAGIDHLVDPEARHTTVGDLFGFPDGDGTLPVHRLRSVVKQNKAASVAAQRLEDEAEHLTTAEKLKLEHTVTTNDRIVSRKLAWNAAGDLRIMLDKGRVDFKRAQFLESAIEKGQAILLEEARELRQARDDGKISEERYLDVKAWLERHNEVFITETNRLRQVVDEE